MVKSRESKYIGKIAESEAFLGSIREGMSDGFVVFDEEMKVIAANTKAISLFGKNRESFIGSHASEFIPELQSSSFYQNFVEVRRLQKPLQRVDYIEQWDTHFQTKFFRCLMELPSSSLI
ncbi:MAG: PAS domain-containing protein [Ignavibacteriales bacterium]|nr:PAS domain-containing protein [Ignavibacteriales bacterium]